MRGWRYDSARHSLAARGIKTRYYVKEPLIPGSVEHHEKWAEEQQKIMDVSLSATLKNSNAPERVKAKFKKVIEEGESENELFAGADEKEDKDMEKMFQEYTERVRGNGKSREERAYEREKEELTKSRVGGYFSRGRL